MKSKIRLGFTLIEILVILSIISILAAIIYAATASVREKARKTRCMSNLHQIGLAFRMYCQDYDMIDDTRKIAETKNMSAVLRNYSKNDDIWKCSNAIGSTETAIDYNCNIYPYPKPAPFMPLFEDAFVQCGANTPLYTDINHNISQDEADVRNQNVWLVLRYEGNVTVAKNKTMISSEDICLK